MSTPNPKRSQTRRDYHHARDQRPYVIAQVSDETCNAQVIDQRGKARPCRLPPKHIGERGRLLCAWHLRAEARWLADEAELVALRAWADQIIAELERHLPADISLDFFDHCFPAWTSFTIEMTPEQAGLLAELLRP